MGVGAKKRKGRPNNNLLEIKNKDIIGVIRLEENGITITVTETVAILSRMYATNVYYLGCATYTYLRQLVELEIKEERTEDEEFEIKELAFNMNAFILSDSYAADAEYLGAAYVWHLKYYTEKLDKLIASVEASKDLDEMASNNFAIENMKKEGAMKDLTEE